MHKYTQNEIDNLIKCPKVITNPPKRVMTLDNGHYRNNMELKSEDGQHIFHVFIRENAKFAENFSIGLDYLPPEGESICLFRCNGPHGEHSNDLTTTHHYACHVHVAKDYNINAGRKSELYAETTASYISFEEALLHFLNYCNIKGAEKYMPNLRQLSLPFPDKEG